MTEPTTPDSEPDVEQTARRGGRRRAVRILLLTGVLAFLLDLGTKHLALQTLEHREPVRLLGGALYLTVVRNSGAAFSFGSDYTFVFPMVTLLVLASIAWMARRLRSVPWAISLGLVLGGALGNLVDRIFRAPGPFLGHVVDMVSVFHPAGGVFPVFNVADSALFLGVCLAILLELTGRQRDGRRLSGEPGKSSDTGQAGTDRTGAADGPARTSL